MDEQYLKKIVSMALHHLQKKDRVDAVSVIRKSVPAAEINKQYKGVCYWDIVFQMGYNDYDTVSEKKDDLETELLDALELFHNDTYNPVANVIIGIKVEKIIDWQAVLPETRESTLRLVKEERALLEEVATGRSYREDGLEKEYEARHKQIINISEKAGFDYPITANTLPEWWVEIKELSTYAERRAHISRLFEPIIEELSQSEDNHMVEFSYSMFDTPPIKKAMEDAMLFMRDGRFESAFDRIHTALCGFLKQRLEAHEIKPAESDSLSVMFSKLHSCYEKQIQPPEVAGRIKAVLRSMGGAITSINELRNNNTLVHPNEQLIEKREAELAIRLVEAIIAYITDVEEYYKGYSIIPK